MKIVIRPSESSTRATPAGFARLAASAGPALTRSWLNAAIRLFVALLLAKPLIVVAVRLGATLVVVPKVGEPQATFTDALLGVAIILLAGLLPGVIYRFSGGLMTTQAGTAPRATAGISEQSGHAATSAADNAWMLAQMNAMPPLYAKTATTGAGASSAGAGSAGAGLRAVPAAAGPVGAAVAAATVVGGAAESGGRWLAGQAATAGGVLGDVEAPRVPAPPVPRHGRYGTPGGTGDGWVGGADRGLSGKRCRSCADHDHADRTARPGPSTATSESSTAGHPRAGGAGHHHPAAGSGAAEGPPPGGSET